MPQFDLIYISRCAPGGDVVYSIPHKSSTRCCTLFSCGDLINPLWIYRILPRYFTFTSLSLGQSYDIPSASTLTLQEKHYSDVIMGAIAIAAAALPRCLSNVRAMRPLEHPILWFQDFTSFGEDVSSSMISYEHILMKLTKSFEHFDAKNCIGKCCL